MSSFVFYFHLFDVYSYSFCVHILLETLALIPNARRNKQMQFTIINYSMHAFSTSMKIIRYTTPQEIAEEFFPVRLKLYRDRKSVLESNLEFAAALSKNKARFIEMVTEEKIDLLRGRKSKDATITLLEGMKFSKLSELNSIKMNNTVAKRREADLKIGISVDGEEDQKGSINEYDYLLNMPLSSLTSDKIEALNEEASKTDEKLRRIKATTAQDMWKEDLDKLEPHLRYTT